MGTDERYKHARIREWGVHNEGIACHAWLLVASLFDGDGVFLRALTLLPSPLSNSPPRDAYHDAPRRGSRGHGA